MNYMGFPSSSSLKSSNESENLFTGDPFIKKYAHSHPVEFINLKHVSRIQFILSPSISKQVISYFRPIEIEGDKKPKYYFESFEKKEEEFPKVLTKIATVKPMKKKLVKKINDILELPYVEKDIIKKRQIYTINDLPEEILLSIFELIDFQTRCWIISRVCRCWNRLAKHSILWRELHLTKNNILKLNFEKVLKQCPSLETLILEELKRPTELLRDVSRYCFDIKHLHFWKCQLDSVAVVSILSHVITMCRHIETLDFQDCKITFDGLGNDILNLQELKSLNIGGIRQGVKINDLFTITFNCHKLTELKIFPRFHKMSADRKLTDNVNLVLLQNLEEKLNVLELDVFDLSSVTFNAISNCSKLTHLSLFNAALLNGETFLKFEKLELLQSLKITNANELYSQHFERFFRSKKLNLKNLDISGCWRIEDSALITVLHSLPQLKSLSIKNCKNITNFCLQYLTICKCLQNLNLSYVDINFKRDFKLLQRLIQLKMLIIDSDKFDEDVVEHLLKSSRLLKVKICNSQFSVENFE